MKITYYIFLFTFLLFPFLGAVLSNYVNREKISPALRVFGVCALAHNLLFTLGISFRGDDADYVIFSLEYLCFAWLIWYPARQRSIFRRTLRGLGRTAISLGVLAGFAGILFFIPIAQEYETDQEINFTNDGKSYSTRRYSFGFATLADTKYRFETYGTFKFLPLEYRIDKTTFYGSQTKLDFQSGQMKIRIEPREETDHLVFTSANDFSFFKRLD